MDYGSWNITISVGCFYFNVLVFRCVPCYCTDVGPLGNAPEPLRAQAVLSNVCALHHQRELTEFHRAPELTVDLSLYMDI